MRRADIKKKRRLFKNRISAKGAITKKKAQDATLTIINEQLERAMAELRQQNELLTRRNGELERDFAYAQQAAREREREHGEDQLKIKRLEATLRRIDPGSFATD